MEKDSFENQLRNKILLVESGFDRGSTKEKVWRAIQKVDRPPRKIYWLAAAVFFIIGLAATLHFRNREAIKPTIEAKRNVKPSETNFKKENASPIIIKEMFVIDKLKPVQAEQKRSEELKKSPRLAQLVKENELESSPLISNQVEEKVVIRPEMNKAELSAPSPSLVTEFTVQLKRGKREIEMEHPASETLLPLKRFKLSKDTSVVANSYERQRSQFKIKF